MSDALASAGALLPLDDVVEHRLDNGLRVLVLPLHNVPLVSVWCWYHVGSKDDGVGTTGLAHFVEHMNFKGTRNISRENLKVWIERAGGTWNGYTWLDQTTYLETLASDALDLALQIEAERMHECLYQVDEFESERTVVLSELQGNMNDSAYELDVDVTAAAFRAHPYRWPTIGWKTDLERVEHADLLGYYRRHYVPSNATLVVVGDVDPGTVLDAVVAHFGDIPAGAHSQTPPVAEPEQGGERRVVLRRPGTAAYLQIVHHAPAFADPAFLPLLVADAVLAGGKGVSLWSGGFGRNARTTSPLYRELVETELAVVASSALLPTEQPYLYGVGATLRDGADPDAAEAAVYRAMDDVAAGDLSDHALRKAKNQVLASLAFEVEGATQIAHQLGYFATIADWRMLGELVERVESLKSDDVQAAAQRYWVPERRTVGRFEPQPLES